MTCSFSAPLNSLKSPCDTTKNVAISPPEARLQSRHGVRRYPVRGQSIWFAVIHRPVDPIIIPSKAVRSAKPEQKHRERQSGHAKPEPEAEDEFAVAGFSCLPCEQQCQKCGTKQESRYEIQRVWSHGRGLQCDNPPRVARSGGLDRVQMSADTVRSSGTFVIGGVAKASNVWTLA